MNTIKINVNQQMDGYTFSIGLSMKELIKRWFPNAHPANLIFVAYDIKSDFGAYLDKLESYIYPALLGIDNDNDLNNLGEIQFVDTQTGNILYTIASHEQKV